LYYAGHDPDRVNIEITHNGFFCGLHECMMYVDGTVDWFHNCNGDTWSLLWVEDSARCVINEKQTVYWCLPERVFRDGLVELVNNA
jgi:hypothetical protein